MEATCPKPAINEWPFLRAHHHIDGRAWLTEFHHQAGELLHEEIKLRSKIVVVDGANLVALSISFLDPSTIVDIPRWVLPNDLSAIFTHQSPHTGSHGGITTH